MSVLLVRVTLKLKRNAYWQHIRSATARGAADGEAPTAGGQDLVGLDGLEPSTSSLSATSHQFCDLTQSAKPQLRASA